MSALRPGLPATFDGDDDQVSAYDTKLALRVLARRMLFLDASAG